MSVSRCSGTLGKLGLFLKPVVSSAVPAGRPPRAGPSPRAGPQGLSAELRPRCPHLALRTPRPGLRLRRGLAAPAPEGIGGAGGRECDRCRRLGRPPRGGRPRAPVPARLAGRGRSDARTAAAPRAPARPPSERLARRQHDFCLQAGFPPGHDGRGAPASSRPNVSEWGPRAGGTGGRAGGLLATPTRWPAVAKSPSRSPGAGDTGAAAPLPRGRERRLGLSRLRWASEPGAPGLGRREGVPTGRAARGQGSGMGFGGPASPAGEERPAGRGVPGRRARVHAPAMGIAGLSELWWPM